MNYEGNLNELRISRKARKEDAKTFSNMLLAATSRKAAEVYPYLHT